MKPWQLERWMGTGGADSLDPRHTRQIPEDPPKAAGRLARLLDRGRRRAARERLARATPLVAAGSVLALAAAELADVAFPIELVLVVILAIALLGVRSEEGALRRELRQARVTAVDAIDVERSRIQHDLHDSIQQRLISIRIRLAQAVGQESREDLRETLERLGNELDAALAEIRNVTLGSAPQLLHQRGLREALREAVAQAPLRITMEFRAGDRYPPDVERCVYFSCLEAVQNVLKHAGAKAQAVIRVIERPGRLTFEVEDTGVGFDLGRTHPGRGMTSLADRVGALGGRLRIDTRPGSGTRVRGEIPLG